MDDGGFAYSWTGKSIYEYSAINLSGTINTHGMVSLILTLP